MPDVSADASNEATYRLLHLVRADAGQAIGLLTNYAPAEQALAGHAYALEAYAEVFLAELYCSGIPLSTVDYNGDFTYRPGSPTNAVFAHAAALFDTALGLAGDSTRVAYLAAVGKARALLALADYGGAAAAVASVPDDYRYEVSYTDAIGSVGNFAGFVDSTSYGVADHEGVNGLDYRTSGDPRTSSSERGTYTIGPTTSTLYRPDKYDQVGSSPIVLASGVEARLIEAEQLLHEGDVTGWLAKLNGLRQSPAVCGAITPATTCPLADLTDPGASLSGAAADAARVDLLFRERAFWLFLTGHRQGDLRRLIRQYQRTQDRIYPVGVYPASLLGELYGSHVTVPVPQAERVSNPLFTGCISRDA